MMPTSLLLPLLAALALAPASRRCLAFAPPGTVPESRRRHDHDLPATTTTARRPSPASLFSTREPVASIQPPARSSLDKLEVVALALKRPRGSSVGVELECAPAREAEANANAPRTTSDDRDLSVLSMQLRKAKCAAIWTSDAGAAAAIGREQEGARGDFPGPVPVVYTGPAEDVLATGGDGAGVSAVVLECGQHVDAEALSDFGIIWKVDGLDQLRELSGTEGIGGVFLLSRDMLPQSAEEEAAEELKEALTDLPKSAVTVAPLPTMLPENGEIALGKHYASLGVSSLLLEGACVGDEEDAQYSQYAIEELNKKSSSSFSMTGLTGSTNGHFGVSSHGGEAKWRRTGS